MVIVKPGWFNKFLGMTWQTVKGNRILHVDEAKLFAKCISVMVKCKDLGEVGLPAVVSGRRRPITDGPFEHFSEGVQFSILDDVLHALTTPTKETPKLLAYNESAIYYVYAWLQEFFKDLPRGEDVFGELVLKALHVYPEDLVIDVDSEDEEEDATDVWPKMGCLKYDCWEMAIDFLADRILWDRDFEIPPFYNPQIMQFGDIALDYFSARPRASYRHARERLLDRVDKVLAL